MFFWTLDIIRLSNYINISNYIAYPITKKKHDHHRTFSWSETPQFPAQTFSPILFASKVPFSESQKSGCCILEGATPNPHQSNTVSDLRAVSCLLRPEFLTQFWLIFVKWDRSCSLFINMNEAIFSDVLRNQVQYVTWSIKSIIVYQCLDHPNHQDYQVSQPCLGLCGTKSGLSKTHSW